jgi:hypothetical protein
MAEEIQRADPRLRRTTTLVLTIALLVALASIFLFQSWLGRSVATTPAAALIAQLHRGVAFALLACGLCLLLLGGYVARMATRVDEQRRWPLEQVRVIRDTPIRHGVTALRIARWLNIGAVVLVLIAIAIGVVSWQLFEAGH